MAWSGASAVRSARPSARPRRSTSKQLSRCIFCGYCEEVCPTQAIVLGHDYELADYERPDFIYTKERLLVPDPRKQKAEDLIDAKIVVKVQK